MSTVSIVIPAYNLSKYLSTTLDSVLAQTYQDWECILVNDGSKDTTLDIMNAYARRDNRFHVYSKPNEGLDYTRLYGARHAETDWIIHLDGDDVIEPEYVEKMLKKQAETNADIISPNIICHRYELSDEIWRLPTKDVYEKKIITGYEAVKYTIGGWKLTTGGMLYRKRYAEGIIRGKYVNSDEFSSRQILFQAQKVAFSDACYYYRNQPHSLSHKLSPRLWERLFVDLLLVEFVVTHYDLNDEVCKKQVSAQFFGLVLHAAEAWLSIMSLQKEDRKIVRNYVYEAYSRMDKSMIASYLPQHSKLFIHGRRWFVFMSILYVIMKKIQGKKYDFR